MQTSIALDAHGAIPEEERALPGRRETYAELVRRLSHQSVLKHFDAYADIDWDGDDFRIDPAGAVTRSGRNSPSLLGTSGTRAHLNGKIVEAKVVL